MQKNHKEKTKILYTFACKFIVIFFGNWGRHIHRIIAFQAQIRPDNCNSTSVHCRPESVTMQRKRPTEILNHAYLQTRSVRKDLANKNAVKEKNS